jgi:hypothetical protein
MSNFTDKRIGFHSASRLPLHSQQALAAAMNVDGHVVTDSKIWTAKTEDFPVNRDLRSQSGANFKTSTDIVGATDDLIIVFTGGNQDISNSASFSFVENENTYKIKSEKFNGGMVWTNTKYPAVKLYQRVDMKAVTGSDGAESGGKYQAYHVVETDKDGNEKRVVDWIPPTAVIDDVTGSPVAGYSGKAEVSVDGTAWSCLQDCENKNYAWKLSNENWEFVFMAGMLRFNPLYTPTTDGFGYNKVKWTGFKYIGPVLSEDISDIKKDINDVKSEGISWIILSEENNSVSNA